MEALQLHLSLCPPPPVGLSACLLSVVGVRPGEVGESLLLSRLEQGSAPVTIHIPSSRLQVSAAQRNTDAGRRRILKYLSVLHTYRTFFSWGRERKMYFFFFSLSIRV